MSQSSQQNDYRALLQQALVSLEQMEAKLHASEAVRHEPIAIIGMGFRFPGDANDASSFWQLLVNGADAITEIPRERWNADQFFDPDPDVIGKSYSRWGGFLRQVDMFDPHFFGISPREAISMDPQQRLLLETSWEALENAGQASDKLSGSRTGVFLGMVSTDYANLQMITGGAYDIDAYFGTGNARSIAAGRIAYTFGLHGPAFTVDTACSSSLVAVHQGCQSLRTHECDMALVGGVNLILDPSGYIVTSRGRMASFDGRCKTFDATADGYVRAEGCAMIVIKRLSDAIADGDRVLAVIKGTALNQDGRSSGITAPNGKAQEAVLRAALQDAQLNPDDISYVEAHGTGTSLGDPIEVRALGAVFANGHNAEHPMMIGSVKTNIGHLEGAAGVAGLVKVVLALQNKTIPPHIHFHEPNPYIPWDELPFTVPIQPTEWKTINGKPRIAGLSSFGFSGTNAHIIIAEAPTQIGGEAQFERASHLFTLSAKTELSIRQLAETYTAYFEQNPSASLADVTYSLNAGRSHFDYRLALAADSIDKAHKKLSSWIQNPASPDVRSGVIMEKEKPEAVFLFTGQGSQSVGMARQLYETQPTFREALDQCNEILRSLLEKPLLSIIYPEKGDNQALIDQTIYTQPALFAVEYSLARLWQSWGVEPTVVMGHSVGEYVAACIAGVFSLEDGLKLIAARGRLMQSLPAGGVMVSVFADEARVRTAIAAYEKDVSIAAVNGPGAVVISGAESSIGLVVESLKSDGITSQPLKVSHAFHSPLLDPILDEFERVAESIEYHAPLIGVVSNVYGRLIVDDSISNAAYWRKHVRQTVRFADGIRAIHEEGYRVFLEIGPTPTLIGMARRCEPINSKAVWLASLRSGYSDWEQVLDSLGQLYVHGHRVNWDSFERDYQAQRRKLELPTSPFQRERYWSNFETKAVSYEITTGHPLLGARLDTAMPVFQKRLNASNPPYLRDHRIQDAILLPAAAYAEIAFAAAKQVLEGEHFSVDEMSIYEALSLTANTDRITQMVLTPEEEGASFQYFSRNANETQTTWTLHARGRIRRQQIPDVHESISLDELRTRLSQPVPVEAYYEHLLTIGAEYGPAFRGLEQIWRTDGESLGRIKLPASVNDVSQYSIHPALLDACFQLLGAAVPGGLDREENNIIYVPVGIQHIRILANVGRAVHCYVHLHPLEHDASKSLTGDLKIFNEDGHLVADIDGLQLYQVNRKTMDHALDANIDQWMYKVDWVEQPMSFTPREKQGAGNWLVFAEENAASNKLVADLQSRGENCFLVSKGKHFERFDSGHWEIDPTAPGHFKQLLSELYSQSGQHLDGVLYLWGDLEGLTDQTDLNAVHSSLQRSSGSVLHLVQALIGLDVEMPRLYLVIYGAQAVTNISVVNPISTALWGLGNVIALEQPALHCVRIDLDPSDVGGVDLFAEIWNVTDEDQIAYHNGKRFVARLERGGGHMHARSTSEPVVLEILESGVLENLTLQPTTRRPAGAGELEIEVYATGLNFRDVLTVLDMYRGVPGPLGNECAGKVTAVGEGVTEFHVGDEVIALAGKSFASCVTVSANVVIHKPASLSFAEAATIPVAFLTADYGLNRLAKMKAGDRVLIHAAAGGVGMAAVQLAQLAGAEIFGTAGTEEKRELLRSLGVHHVMNSRTLDFADEIMSITNGEGVDIVLNSLAGEFIPKGISILRNGGRFIEIGKAEIWEQERVRQLKADVDYYALYLGENLQQEPDLIMQMFADLLDQFQSGQLKPLPLHTFPLEEAVDAFRFMARAKHTGKIVVIQEHTDSQVAVREDATYLITGGLGGLGLVSARWLVDQGACHIVLVGRQAPTEEAEIVINELTATGAAIHVASIDVSQRDQIAKLLQDIAREMPPLRGIIHSAGVVDDGILSEQTWSRFETAMRPKVDGAWNLHTLTLASKLDFFIIYSAGASLLGSPGQSNYASANGFLDGLANYRHQCDLPVLSINWGGWADVGMASKLGSENQRRWANLGMRLIKPIQGMQALQQLVETQATQMAVLPIDWTKFGRSRNGSPVQPLLRHIVQAKEQNASAGAGLTLEQIKEIPYAEREQALQSYARTQIVKTLGLELTQSFNPSQLLINLGMDSLMAVELKNKIDSDLKINLPISFFLEEASVIGLAAKLSQALGRAEEQTQEVSKSDLINADRAQALLDNIDQLSEDEVNALLNNLLTDGGAA